MTVQRERNGRKRKQRVAVAALAALLSSGALLQASPQETKTKEKEKQTLTTQNKIYCNIKALNPVERQRHKQLTDKLIAARREIAETEKGYEFQYSPSNVSIGEGRLGGGCRQVLSLLIFILTSSVRATCSVFG